LENKRGRELIYLPLEEIEHPRDIHRIVHIKLGDHTVDELPLGSFLQNEGHKSS
jgi:hypothetical protein